MHITVNVIIGRKTELDKEIDRIFIYGHLINGMAILLILKLTSYQNVYN